MNKITPLFPGIYKINNKLVTENLTPGFKVYGEKLIRRNTKEGKEFRVWDPYRSKLAAGILNGLKEFPILPKTNVLYLGASAGTTSSHISDIVKEGIIYCVEFSKRMMQELLHVCEKRKNMIPILGDANKPKEYSSLIFSDIDVIYQDVAQRNQAEILIKNAKIFSPRYAFLAIKSRSINSIKKPKKIFNQEIEKLKKGNFTILQTINLKPYDKDHVLLLLKYST